jgi:MoaA/NifB/PqqE/SkfB family radical SAM enzyme
MADTFAGQLADAGCKAVVFVEYVPADGKSHRLAPDERTRLFMDLRLQELRNTEHELLFISFPGDEKNSGGCLAAGRGFFHINAHGGAEPCPFSPYSDTSLLTTPLFEALNSPLFVKLRSEDFLTKEHAGGCVLFEQENQVKALLGV